MKKFVLIFIASRTLVSAFYDVNVLGPIRVTDLAGFTFLLAGLLYLIRLNSSKKTKGKSAVMLPLAWLMFSSMWILVSYGNLFMIYGYSKQIIRFANGAMAFILFASLFKSVEDIRHLAIAIMIGTFFPMLQIILIASFGPGAFGLQTMEMDDHSLIMGVYGNYGVFATSTFLGMIAILILWGTGSSDRSRHRYLTLGFLGYIMGGLITLSRILLGQMMGITAIFLYSLGRRKNIGIIVLFVLGFIVLSNTSYFEEQTGSISARSEYEIQVLQGEKGREYALHGRVQRWENTFEYFIDDYSLLEQLVGANIHIGPHGDYFYWLFAYGWIGLFIYLRLNARIIGNAFRQWNRYKDTEYRMFGAAMLSTAFVWVISAIATTPSFMPDTMYTVFGLMGISMNTNLLKQDEITK